jgi:hypothetical protein
MGHRGRARGQHAAVGEALRSMRAAERPIASRQLADLKGGL